MPYLAKVGEGETIPIFEAIAKHAIDSDMRAPDERKSDPDWRRQCYRRTEESDWSQINVNSIINDRAGARPREIA